MDTRKKSLDRNSFVWNAGGWFGSQVGGSVWMLFCALTVLPADAISGLVCLGSFAVINAVGCYLWQRREKNRSIRRTPTTVFHCRGGLRIDQLRSVSSWISFVPRVDYFNRYPCHFDDIPGLSELGYEARFR